MVGFGKGVVGGGWALRKRGVGVFWEKEVGCENGGRGNILGDRRHRSTIHSEPELSFSL